MPGFRQLGERELYSGFPARVLSATFEAPDGSSFERDVVRHIGAVGVVPLHDDGTVTLVRQYRAPLDAELLEIPAGLRDVDDEPPDRTAVRELAEEAGLAAAHVEHLVTFHNSPGFSDESVDVFVATGLTECDTDLQGIEEQGMSAERVPLADAWDAVLRGDITDAKTVIGLALVRDRLSTGDPFAATRAR